jgi:hypothetical protein
MQIDFGKYFGFNTTVFQQKGRHQQRKDKKYKLNGACPMMA